MSSKYLLLPFFLKDTDSFLDAKDDAQLCPYSVAKVLDYTVAQEFTLHDNIRPFSSVCGCPQFGESIKQEPPTQ